MLVTLRGKKTLVARFKTPTLYSRSSALLFYLLDVLPSFLPLSFFYFPRVRPQTPDDASHFLTLYSYLTLHSFFYSSFSSGPRALQPRFRLSFVSPVAGTAASPRTRGGRFSFSCLAADCSFAWTFCLSRAPLECGDGLEASAIRRLAGKKPGIGGALDGHTWAQGFRGHATIGK